MASRSPSPGPASPSHGSSRESKVFISKAHDEVEHKGRDSPGPVYDVHVEAVQTRPAHVIFPQSRRMSPEGEPFTDKQLQFYQAAQVMSSISDTNAITFSHGRRFADVPVPGRDSPGPGSYSPPPSVFHDGPAISFPRAQRNPAVKKENSSQAAHTSSILADVASDDEMINRTMKPGQRPQKKRFFAKRSGSKPESGNRFLSPQMIRTIPGKDSPGPVFYPAQKPATQGAAFTKALRTLGSKGPDTPSPLQYADFVSKGTMHSTGGAMPRVGREQLIAMERKQQSPGPGEYNMEHAYDAVQQRPTVSAFAHSNVIQKDDRAMLFSTVTTSPGPIYNIEGTIGRGPAVAIPRAPRVSPFAVPSSSSPPPQNGMSPSASSTSTVGESSPRSIPTLDQVSISSNNKPAASASTKPGFSFGSAHSKARYVSAQHTDVEFRGRTSPGPVYNLPQVSDTPAFSIPKGSRADFVIKDAPLLPGPGVYSPAFEAQSKFAHAPAYSMMPRRAPSP